MCVCVCVCVTGWAPLGTDEGYFTKPEEENEEKKKRCKESHLPLKLPSGEPYT